MVLKLFSLFPFLRLLVNIPAGLAKMPVKRFLVLTFLGNLLFHAGFMYITYESRRPGSPDFFHEGTNEFCYLPGLPYEDYRPVGAGMFVPAGSDMIVSLHYTTTGLAVVDRTRIGFTVSKNAPEMTTPLVSSSSRMPEPQGDSTTP